MNINRLIKDLKNGNNPEENLSTYSQLLLSSYQKIAYGEYALDFTEKYDLLAEEKSGIIYDSLKVVTDITRSVGEGDFSALEAEVKALDQCRNDVIAMMSELEKYIHYLGLYEHIYNRLQFKYEQDAGDYDADVLMEKLMAYINDADDVETANARIQSVLGELPVRMTRLKFLELLENGCLCYVGARNDMADDFFSRLKVCAQAPGVCELNPKWEDLFSIARELEQTDLTAVTKAQIRDLSVKIQVGGQLLAKQLSYAMDLLDLINTLYTILITTPYIVQPDRDVEKDRRILKAYMKAVDSGDFLDIDEDILGGLEKTVENQEKYLGEHMLLEDTLDFVCEKYASQIQGMMLSGPYSALSTAQRLGGINPTADISHTAPYFSADEAYIRKYIEEMSDVYCESFKQSGQLIKRALISMAFENMPVPFDSLDKVTDFIRQSLNSCTEGYERAATRSLLDGIITMEM